TASISDGEEWLASLDRFGIVSPRAVLLDGATLRQNLAMPLTLEIDPVPPAISAEVERLAIEVGLDPALLDRPIAALDAATRGRATTRDVDGVGRRRVRGRRRGEAPGPAAGDGRIETEAPQNVRILTSRARRFAGCATSFLL